MMRGETLVPKSIVVGVVGLAALYPRERMCHLFAVFFFGIFLDDHYWLSVSRKRLMSRLTADTGTLRSLEISALFFPLFSFPKRISNQTLISFGFVFVPFSKNTMFHESSSE